MQSVALPMAYWIICKQCYVTSEMVPVYSFVNMTTCKDIDSTDRK